MDDEAGEQVSSASPRHSGSGDFVAGLELPNPAEPAYSFNQAVTKLLWADKLTEFLIREAVAYSDRRPYRLSIETDPASGVVVFGAEITETIPPHIVCLLGDVCQNLRSSLDYCFMGVKRSLLPSAKRTGNLPIADNAKGVASKVTGAFGDLPPNELDKLTILFRDRIRSHYDFKNGGNRDFADLNDLSNRQKHSLLIATSSVTRLPADAQLISDDGSVAHVGGARIGANAVGMHGNVKFLHSGSATIEIRMSGERVVDAELCDGLIRFRRTVSSAIEAFCDAFPSEKNPVFVRN